jgi:AcrR family transcriptional regulator
MRDGTLTRERIEETAMALFVSKGVTETTIRDIAQGAGVAEGALYRHYRGKDELIVDLFARHYAAFANRLERAHAPFPATCGRLEGMIEECCRVFDQEPVLFSFLLLVQHHSIQRIEGGDTTVETVRAVIARGIERGEVQRGALISPPRWPWASTSSLPPSRPMADFPGRCCRSPRGLPLLAGTCSRSDLPAFTTSVTPWPTPNSTCSRAAASCRSSSPNSSAR